MEAVELRKYGSEGNGSVKSRKCGSVEEGKSGVWMMWLGNP